MVFHATLNNLTRAAGLAAHFPLSLTPVPAPFGSTKTMPAASAAARSFLRVLSEALKVRKVEIRAKEDSPSKGLDRLPAGPPSMDIYKGYPFGYLRRH